MESAFLRMWDVCSVIFCGSCFLMLPGICRIYFSNPFYVSPRALITTRIVVAFTSYILSISISRSLYLPTRPVDHIFERFCLTAQTNIHKTMTRGRAVQPGPWYTQMNETLKNYSLEFRRILSRYCEFPCRSAAKFQKHLSLNIMVMIMIMITIMIKIIKKNKTF